MIVDEALDDDDGLGAARDSDLDGALEEAFCVETVPPISTAIVAAEESFLLLLSSVASKMEAMLPVHTRDRKNPSARQSHNCPNRLVCLT